MMRCEHFEGWIAAEADGVLGAPERDLLTAHLEQCPACRDRLAEQRQMATVLTNNTPPSVGAAEWSAQWDRIAAALPASAAQDSGRQRIPERAEHPRIIRPFAWRVWAPTAIAASVLFAAVWWLTIGSTPGAVASPVHMARAEDADIEEIDVVGEHTTCMIVQTSPEYAAVIWISDDSEEEMQ